MGTECLLVAPTVFGPPQNNSAATSVKEDGLLTIHRTRIIQNQIQQSLFYPNRGGEALQAKILVLPIQIRK